MSTPRLATSLLLRSSRSATPRTIRQFRAPLCAAISHPSIPTRISSFKRPYSSQEVSKPSKIYFFSDIQALTKSPSTDKPKPVLIDTREPSELAFTGTIPGSINIPVTTSPEAFFLSPEEFEDKFGFERPGKGEELVFYCKAGVRSRAAAEIAKRAGWERVGEYSGSWLDWEKNGGEAEKVK